MPHKLFVGGIPFSTTSDTLRTLFEPSGTVLSADIVMDRDTGRSRGFGFVEMETEQEAKQAVAKLNGHEVNGRQIRVELSTTKSGSRSGFGHRRD